MRNNVRNVVKLPEIETKVISFDKNGKRIEKRVKNSDRFLVTLTNGDSVVLKKAELSMYNIIFNSVEEKDAKSFKEIEDDLITDEEVEESSNPSEVQE